MLTGAAQIRGDPHITTLDDLTYTFNGHGEYVLLQTLDGETPFQLQVRSLCNLFFASF